ncbi:B12-binding domain-containing radical SAM protein [Gudongella sp. DL1XJH-153]|uniref:B12-binding domain-containing radical SAM protein n=1 Tax=Gudongella sp. DL1XJH-153 TaxID=3409804 RepID=UPI003BB78266
MSVILTTLNSKFIHSNLALRYLREYVKDIEDIQIEEYTINQNLGDIASKIYELKPKLVGFSTYIWNIDETLEICERLKLVSPQTKILLGGPEVSYDMEELLTSHPYIDYIVYGEGEETFRELLIKKNLESIEGLAFREGDKILINSPRTLIKDINSIPSPYESIGDEFKNKIVYYESSRGCPFNCAFCLSSTIRGVRYMNLDRVKRDLDNLIDVGVKQVKFVDRTFNANKDFSQAIMSHIIERNPVGINFHFEVTAHLIDNEQLEFFKDIKEGLFQFEIGVQSTNPKTIEAIGRNTDFERLAKVTRTIRQSKNIHQHLDLIAGLPYEDYHRFGVSFDHIFQLRPEKIQLGFLKLLKGSALRNLREEYGYGLIDKAPYEVMKSKWISYDDVIALKGIEELVEKYYNEEYFKHSIEYILQNQFPSPFRFFEDLMKFWKEQGLYDLSHSKDRLYEILMDYYKKQSYDQFEIFIELLAFDYLQNNKGKPLPEYFNIGNGFDMTRSHELLKSKALLSEILPEYMDITTKKLLKKVKIQEFKHDLYEIINSGYRKKSNKQKTLVLFNYKDGVLERCKTYNISSYAEELTE